MRLIILLLCASLAWCQNPAYYDAAGVPYGALGNPEAIPTNGLVAAWSFVGNPIKYPEPLQAQVYLRSAGITQASFTESGLTNGVQFPASSTTEYAYMGVTLTAGGTYVFSAYVVMADESSPRVKYPPDANTDMAIIFEIGAITTAYSSVTLVSGSLYRISGVLTSATGGAGKAGVRTFDAPNCSGKAFRITGFQVTPGLTPAPYRAPADASSQTFPNLVQPALNLTLGSSAGADSNDPTLTTTSLSFTTDDEALSPTLTSFVPSADRTLYLVASATGSSGTISSFADPTSSTEYSRIQIASSGNLQICSKHGAGDESCSSSLAVPTTGYLMLAAKQVGGTLSLTRMDTGASVSVASAGPTGTPRFALGSIGGSTPASFASSMLASYAAIYSRATSAAEDAAAYAVLKSRLPFWGVSLP